MAWVSVETRALTVDEMKNNAVIIYEYLSGKGWTLNAVSGLLGNVQVESSLNPQRWQNDIIGDLSAGYGLIQWTPASDFFSWCNARGLAYKSGNTQCYRINYELENEGWYYPTASYPISKANFKSSNESPSYLASTYLYNRERPGDPSASEAERRANAETWAIFLESGEWDPVDPTDPEDKMPIFPGWNVPLAVKYGAIVSSKKRRGGYIRGISIRH